MLKDLIMIFWKFLNSQELFPLTLDNVMSQVVEEARNI